MYNADSEKKIQAGSGYYGLAPLLAVLMYKVNS